MTEENNLYRRAFPKYLNLERISPPRALNELIESVWKQKQLDVLCFGFGWGLTEATLLSSIKHHLTKHKSKRAVVRLIDSPESNSLYGPINDRPVVAPKIIQYPEREPFASPSQYDKNQYHIVTAYFSLHFISGWPAKLRTLGRLVRPGGLLSLAVERGYRAWVDGSTDIAGAEDCTCREWWRQYHNMRIAAGDGWFPDISATDLGVIAAITNGDFSVINFNGRECLPIKYPDNVLRNADVDEIVNKYLVFLPIKTGTSERFVTESPPKPLSCEKTSHPEEANLFFLKRETEHDLWSDEETFIRKAVSALSAHAIRVQNRITLPVLRPGVGDEIYDRQMRNILSNILQLLYTHFVRHCRRSACEMVFVKYQRMSEFYSLERGARTYIGNLPMVASGDDDWLRRHEQGYSTWRRYLSREHPEDWIGQYVMELFPWVGAWEIHFGSAEPAVKIQKKRYAPHEVHDETVWNSEDHCDVLEIHLKADGVRHVCGENEEQRRVWYNDTDVLVAKVAENKSVTKSATTDVEQKNDLSLQFGKILSAYPGYREVNVGVEKLSELLCALSSTNATNRFPWKTIYYLAVPQTGIARDQNSEESAMLREHTGIGIVLYTCENTPFTKQAVHGLLQLLPSLMRLTQLQLQYLYLNERQSKYAPVAIEQYRFENRDKNDFLLLSDKDIDEVYEAIYPSESAGAYGLKGQALCLVGGVPVVVSPAHGTSLNASIANCRAVINALRPHTLLRHVVTYVNNALDAARNDRDATDLFKLHAWLRRHKGSFVPVDLAYLVWQKRSSATIKYVFWDVAYTVKNYINYLNLKKIGTSSVEFKDLGDYCVIVVSCTDRNRGVIKFATQVLRGEVPYGDEQSVINGIFDLRTRLGCTEDTGVHEAIAPSRLTIDQHGEYGKRTYGDHGIAVWLAHSGDAVELAVWLKYTQNAEQQKTSAPNL